MNRLRSEPGVLKMDVVREIVDATPAKPHAPQIVLVVATSNDHIERIAELVSRSSGRRCRIRALPVEVAVIESDLFTMGTKSRCYAGLDPSSTCKVYKVTARLLEFWD